MGIAAPSPLTFYLDFEMISTVLLFSSVHYGLVHHTPSPGNLVASKYGSGVVLQLAHILEGEADITVLKIIQPAHALPIHDLAGCMK